MVSRFPLPGVLHRLPVTGENQTQRGAFKDQPVYASPSTVHLSPHTSTIALEFRLSRSASLSVRQIRSSVYIPSYNMESVIAHSHEMSIGVLKITNLLRPASDNYRNKKTRQSHFTTRVGWDLPPVVEYDVALLRRCSSYGSSDW